VYRNGINIRGQNVEKLAKFHVFASAKYDSDPLPYSQTRQLLNRISQTSSISHYGPEWLERIYTTSVTLFTCLMNSYIKSGKNIKVTLRCVRVKIVPVEN
jgi:hypothetical protein